MRKRFFFSLNEMAKPHKRANDSVKVCAFPNNDCTMGKYESTRKKFSFKESKCLIKKTCWNHKRKKKNKEISKEKKPKTFIDNKKVLINEISKK